MRRRILVVLLALLSAASPVGSHGDAPSVTVYEPLESMFHVYGDAGASWTSGPRTWTGADSAFSVELPDGRTAWLFSDSFLSPTNGCGASEPHPCHRRRTFQPFVNNTIVVQDGDELDATSYGGTHDSPRALIEPPGARPLYSFYWVGDGTVEGDELRVFVHRYPKTPGTIPPSAESNDVASFALPDMTLVRIDEGIAPDGTVRPWAFLPGRDSPVPIVWGAGVLEDGDHIYVYGTEEYPLHKWLHVARAPRGRLLDAPWEYWTGAGWSPRVLDSTRLLGNVAGELSVVKAGDGYRLVTSELGIGDIVMHTAPRPEGPWGGRRQLLSPPEAARGAWAYNAKEHPQYATASTIVVSYNVNGELDGNDIYEDVHVYRPRFVEIDIS